METSPLRSILKPRTERMRFQKGSLKKDKHGRWVVRWREDVIDVATGETRRRYPQEILDPKTFSKRDAERYLAKKVAEVNDTNYRPTARGVTFAEFAENWQKTVMIHHKASSQDSEKAIVKNHLSPAFGEFYLNDVSAEMVQRYVNQFPLGRKTLDNVIGLMTNIWDHAMAYGYVKHNPFPRGVTGRSLLRKPVSEKGETYNYSLEEALAIIDKAEGKWKLLFRTLAEGGMRPGELAGMRKTDLVGRVICLSQSVYHGEIQAPKTKNSVRQFPVSQKLADDLREFMASTDGERNPHNLVWFNGAGNPVAMNWLQTKILDPILDELGIRERLRARGVKAGLYPFRHMVATELRRRGVPLATIQQRMGHAVGSKVTDVNYVHAVDADALAAADLLGKLLNPGTSGRIQ